MQLTNNLEQKEHGEQNSKPNFCLLYNQETSRRQHLITAFREIAEEKTLCNLMRWFYFPFLDKKQTNMTKTQNFTSWTCTRCYLTQADKAFVIYSHSFHGLLHQKTRPAQPTSFKEGNDNWMHNSPELTPKHQIQARSCNVSCKHRKGVLG